MVDLLDTQFEWKFYRLWKKNWSYSV